MVDARIVQTTKALHAAIIELAGAAPVSSITVADVTRAAGINRATFYSHATSPGALLADVLTPELDAIRDEDTRMHVAATLSPADITRKGMETVVEHVVKYRDIYRLALPDPLDASTHRVLARHLEESSLKHMADYPSGTTPDGVSTAIAAGFIAHGLVGAIETWLTGKRSAKKVLVENLVLLMPPWWD